MIKKIMYFILVIAVGIAVYYVDYSNKQYEHTLGLLNTALEEKNYVNVARIFGGIFDSKSIVDYENDGDKLDLVIYPSTNLSQHDFGEETEDIKYKYEKSYAFYIYEPTFDLASYLDESIGANVNYSGIKFISTEKEYNYYFIVNNEMNNSYYKKSPNDLTEAQLNGSRDYVTTYETVGFMSIPFTESVINEIVDELDGNINKMQVMDAKGNPVYEVSISLDFKEQFYLDCENMINEYNDFITKLEAAKNDKNKKNEILSDFEAKNEEWLEEFDAFDQPTYMTGYEKEYLNPEYLKKQTIGTLAIYLVIAFVLYILFFHRKLIKILIYKILRKPLPEDEDDTPIDDDEYSIEDDMIDVDAGKNLEKEESQENKE